MQRPETLTKRLTTPYNTTRTAKNALPHRPHCRSRQRLRGHADVFPGMSVYEHAAQHLRAQEAYVAAEGGAGVPPVLPDDSYADLLRIYAMGMFLDSVHKM